MKTLHAFFYGTLLWLCAGTLIAQDITEVETLRLRLDSLSEEISGLNETVDFTLVDAPVAEVLRAVAETHQLNISFYNLPEYAITNNFNNVKVKDLLTFLCAEYHLTIRFTHNIFTFYAHQDPIPNREIIQFDSEAELISINAQNDLLSGVAAEITQKSGVNVLVNQMVGNQVVYGYVRDLPLEVALENFAEANNLKLEKKADRVYQISALQPVQMENQVYRQNQNYRQNNRGVEVQTFLLDGEPYVTLTANQLPSGEIIRSVFESMGMDYVLLGEPQGMLNCRLDSVPFDSFLEVALEPGNFSYSITENGVYLIGEGQGGKLSTASVFSFKNRSVEGVEEVIPQVLLQQVQVKLFKDLNAMIITGSDKATRKLKAFLSEIDRPVPNVLIEVIVVEIRKGASVRTGVKAFLSDSVPITNGQIFPGIDVTLSSASFNRFLNNLDSRGIMNLGRVTPSFYATIQAMEENNNLNIRSTPKLSTLNGHEASLTIGQSVYYLIENQFVTPGVTPIVTVTPRYEKVEANLSLKISPFVSDLEDVTLSIDAEFSDFIPPEIEGTPPGNATRKFISKIRVKNEEMIVIGGLEEASRSDTGSGVPVLSRIPGLKWLFSSRSRANSNNKLLIFIKPTIVY